MTGAELIMDERRRQIDIERWTPEHDRAHGGDCLERAAISYAAWGESEKPPATWPWDLRWWKPKDRLRNLVRAGALFQAAGEASDLIPALRHWAQRDLVAAQIDQLLSAVPTPTEDEPDWFHDPITGVARGSDRPTPTEETR
jgi:hypothetical protein